ncbi:MAG TPA: hypothetical protein VG754_05245 [Verrucomicrobiae bacterium]|nr:hypothetical protein [Verrucomicrobiae bacterium]
MVGLLSAVFTGTNGARLDEPQQHVTIKTRQANSCTLVLPVLLRVTDPRSEAVRGPRPVGF